MKLALRSSLVLLLATGAAWEASAAEGAGRAWQRLVGLLQYLEADYPAAVASQSSFELAEQASLVDEALEAGRELGPAGQAFIPRLASIQERVARGVDPGGVSRDCQALAEDLVL